MIKTVLLLPLCALVFTGCAPLSEPIGLPGITDKSLPVGLPQTTAVSAKAPINTSADTVVQGRSPIPESHSSGPNFWPRFGKGLVFSNIKHPRIDGQLRKLKRSNEIDILAKRARPLIYYLSEAVQSRGLPLDLTLVAMVESGLRPTAVSHTNDVGLWQFQKVTGKYYGLYIAKHHDGRYDIHAATLAALDYFARLHKFFKGDWLLALAAYNCGEGTVQQAMRQNAAAGKKTDFWHLQNLPSITRAYVPKILALSRIFANPKAHKVRLQPLSDAPYLAGVDLESGVNPFQLATAAQVGHAIVKRYNPALKKNTKLATPYTLLLPQRDAGTLVTKLGTLNNIKLATWSRSARKRHYSQTLKRYPNALVYQAKAGETIGLVARRFGLPASKLAQWNDLYAGSALRPGQKVIIPSLAEL